MEYDPTNLKGWNVISDTLPCTVSNALFNVYTVDDVMYIYCLFVIVNTGRC